VFVRPGLTEVTTGAPGEFHHPGLGLGLRLGLALGLGLMLGIGLGLGLGLGIGIGLGTGVVKFSGSAVTTDTIYTTDHN